MPLAARQRCGILWLLPLLFRPAQTKPHGVFKSSTRIVDGCYYVNRRYANDGASVVYAHNYTICQEHCANSTDCAFFSFQFSKGDCWLTPSEGTALTRKFSDMMIAGPKACPAVPSGCTEVPMGEFPAATASASMQAWPSRRVPEKLECWPRNENGGFYAACPVVRVLEDTAKGWPGKCEGLEEVVVPHGETCESFCRRRVTCSIYQVVGSHKACFHGLLTAGLDCYWRESDATFTPVEAKRIMHGEVRVLKNLTGVQIVGLKQTFGEDYFINITNAAKACKWVCYSNIGCQWWQYSKSQGCWVESPSKSGEGAVRYPMTLSSWKEGTEFARTVVAGEYIQHICPGYGGVPAHSAEDGYSLSLDDASLGDGATALHKESNLTRIVTMVNDTHTERRELARDRDTDVTLGSLASSPLAWWGSLVLALLAGALIVVMCVLMTPSQADAPAPRRRSKVQAKSASHESEASTPFSLQSRCTQDDGADVVSTNATPLTSASPPADPFIHSLDGLDAGAWASSSLPTTVFPLAPPPAPRTSVWSPSSSRSPSTSWASSFRAPPSTASALVPAAAWAPPTQRLLPQPVATSIIRNGPVLVASPVQSYVRSRPF